MLKYVLTNEEKVNGTAVKLFRIKVVRDFSNVHNGDYGGWIESYNNLSQEVESQVYDNSEVYRNSFISDDAMIMQPSQVFEIGYRNPTGFRRWVLRQPKGYCSIQEYIFRYLG